MAIRRIRPEERDAVLAIVNDAAQAYRGVIPTDRWHEPYMPTDELATEIADGVAFWVAEDADRMVGVMGIQDKGEVALVRHAYVSSGAQKKGVGTQLLRHVQGLVDGGGAPRRYRGRRHLLADGLAPLLPVNHDAVLVHQGRVVRRSAQLDPRRTVRAEAPGGPAAAGRQLKGWQTLHMVTSKTQKLHGCIVSLAGSESAAAGQQQSLAYLYQFTHTFV